MLYKVGVMRFFNISSHKLKSVLLYKMLIFKLLLLLLLSVDYSFAYSSNSNNKCESFKIGSEEVCLEIPKNREEKRLGLMFREKLLDNHGMLFSWDKSRKYCMWMKNTLIPLGVAFIDKNFKIKQIKQMRPKSLKSHCADTPVMYVVEMNKGWFKKNNIKLGDKLGYKLGGKLGGKLEYKFGYK